MLENGTSNLTRLYVSNQTVFTPGNAMIDDTTAIQMLTKNVQGELIYILVEAKQKITKNVQMKMILTNTSVS